MANDFKRFVKKDIGTGEGASGSTVYTVPAGSGSSALESIVIGITIANKSTAGITCDVFIDALGGASDDVYVVKDASIPAGSSLEVMSGNKLVLQHSGSAGDVLKMTSSTASAADGIVSVLEDV
tara:strand:- start:1172 stop:1543 length:372 start_codon:yes stop_codon:yes gene_type:complete